MSKPTVKPDMRVLNVELSTVLMKMALGELVLMGGSMFNSRENDKLLLLAYERLPNYNTMSAVAVPMIGTLIFLSEEMIV